VGVSGIRILLGRNQRRPQCPNREESMVRTFMIAAACAAVVMLSPTAFAQGQFGTADEAKAMLVKAAAAMKADKTKTLDLINKGEGGFLDRDLYPFCFDPSDGKILAVASNNAKQFLGTDIRALKDATGRIYGPELHAAAQKPEGQITEVSYMFPRPGADKTPVLKVSFVTKVGDLGCGVGHYK
jgi:Single Cache domain 2